MLAVSGCVPSSWHVGSALLYSPHQRVSTSKLADEVANLTVGYNKYKHKTQINYTPADMPRQVLSWMLRFAAEDTLAAGLDIKVSPAQAQAANNAEAQSVAQAGDTLTEAAVLNGLPPDMLPQLGNWIAIQIRLDKILVNKYFNGKAPTSQSGQAILTARANRLVCVAAKVMHIKVNPQFGVYDYHQLAVVAKPSPLSAPAPAPSPTKIQSTPNC
jgi:hypothetical protein